MRKLLYSFSVLVFLNLVSASHHHYHTAPLHGGKEAYKITPPEVKEMMRANKQQKVEQNEKHAQYKDSKKSYKDDDYYYPAKSSESKQRAPPQSNKSYKEDAYYPSQTQSKSSSSKYDQVPQKVQDFDLESCSDDFECERSEVCRFPRQGEWGYCPDGRCCFKKDTFSSYDKKKEAQRKYNEYYEKQNQQNKQVQPEEDFEVENKQPSHHHSHNDQQENKEVEKKSENKKEEKQAEVVIVNTDEDTEDEKIDNEHRYQIHDLPKWGITDDYLQ